MVTERLQKWHPWFLTVRALKSVKPYSLPKNCGITAQPVRQAVFLDSWRKIPAYFSQQIKKSPRPPKFRHMRGTKNLKGLFVNILFILVIRNLTFSGNFPPLLYDFSDSVFFQHSKNRVYTVHLSTVSTEFSTFLSARSPVSTLFFNFLLKDAPNLPDFAKNRSFSTFSAEYPFDRLTNRLSTVNILWTILNVLLRQKPPLNKTQTAKNGRRERWR